MNSRLESKLGSSGLTVYGRLLIWYDSQYLRRTA